MEVIAEFFVDPLVVPAYYYFLGYGVAWSIAFILARLFMNGKNDMERAVIKAWGVALSLHIIGGLFFIVWIFIRAKNAEEEWAQIPLYLSLYLIIFFVDMGLLINLLNKRPKKEKATASAQKMPSRSRNPKKPQ